MEGSHQTALHLSVRYRALSAVQILSSYGADVNAVDSSGMTPLHMAAGILHKDLIASLIKEGADINKVCAHVLLETPNDSPFTIFSVLLILLKYVH